MSGKEKEQLAMYPQLTTKTGRLKQLKQGKRGPGKGSSRVLETGPAKTGAAGPVPPPLQIGEKQ